MKDFFLWLDISFTPRIYPENETLNRVVRYVLDHKDEFRFLRQQYWVYAVRDRKVFAFWIANRWYAYLSHLEMFDVKEKDAINPEFLRTRQCNGVTKIRNYCPSKDLAFRFYTEIDRQTPTQLDIQNLASEREILRALEGADG